MATSKIKAIAAWHVAQGSGHLKPFADVAWNVPDHLAPLAEELRTVTFADLAPQVSATQEHETLRLLLSDFTPRERTLLLERVASDRPTTLQSLGQRFGVSHQRVAQLERDFRRKIAENVAAGTHYGTALRHVAGQVGWLMPLRAALDRWPTLGHRIPGSDLPVWQLVGKLTDFLDAQDGWLASPSLEHAERVFHRLVDELAIYPGVASIGPHRDVWGFTDDELHDWGERLGYAVLQDFVITPAAHVTDALAQALIVSSASQTADELGRHLALIGNPRSTATIAAALREDPRFERDGNAWRLAREIAPYPRVLKAVEDLIRTQGPTPLGEVVEAGVAAGGRPESIPVYARFGYLETVDGLVRLRETAHPLAFPPAEAPGVIRLDDGWANLVTLGAEELGTARLGLSSAIAPLLGLSLGERIDLPSLPGASIGWEGPLVTAQLPPEVLLPYQVGDRIFLWFGFGDCQVRRAAPLDPELEGAALALNLLGLTGDGHDDVDRRRLATALEAQPGSPHDDLIEACVRKREFAAARALGALL